MREYANYRTLEVGYVGAGAQGTRKYLSVVPGMHGLLAAIGLCEWEVPHDGVLFRSRLRETLSPSTGTDTALILLDGTTEVLNMTTSGSAQAQSVVNSNKVAVTAGQMLIFAVDYSSAAASTDIQISVRYAPGRS